MPVENVDVEAMTPEDFAQLVKRSSDGDLARTIEQAGPERVLSRVFGTIPDRLKSNAASVSGSVQFRISAEGEAFEHALTIEGGRCTHTAGAVERPRATVSSDVVVFAKLITGQANEITLFLRRKLKIDGDLAFAQGFLRYFDRPRA